MGTEIDGDPSELNRAAYRAPRATEFTANRKGAPKKRGIVLWMLFYLVVIAVTYAIFVEQSHRGEFARKAVGHCFKTGIGAVGMAIDTAGTGTVWLMFGSGLKTTYPIKDLVETSCPSSAAQ
jgi:hypothetical protein